MKQLRTDVFFWRALVFVITAFMTNGAGGSEAITLDVVRKGGETLDEIPRVKLDSLTQQFIETTSPYFEGKVRFSGPSLEDVLEFADEHQLDESEHVTLRALNNYFVNTTIGFLTEAGAIIATRKNGEQLSIRDRGPFWIILPLSDRPELDNEDYHRLLVWQLSRIEIGD